MGTLYRSSYRLILKIYDANNSSVVLKELAVLQTGYELSINSIPEAIVQVPVANRNVPVASSDWTKSTSRALDSDDFTTFRAYMLKKPKAALYMVATGTQPSGVDWPNDEFCIFRGRVQFVQKKLQSDANYISITLRHWLTYLNTSSALSTAAHPNNALQLSFSTLLSSTDQTGAASESRTLYQTTVSSHFFRDRADMESDFWGKGLKKMFCNILQDDSLVFSDAIKNCVGQDKPAKDPNVQEALTRILGDTGGNCTSALPANVPPLALSTPMRSLDISAIQSLAYSIGQESLDSFARQTVWTKLQAYASEFLFLIVPRVEDAILVPFSPAAIPTNPFYLSGQAILSYDASAESPKSIQAMVMSLPVSSMFSGPMPQGGEAQPLSTRGLVGCYYAGTSSGLIQVLPTPLWMNQLIVERGNISATANPKNPTNTATTPAPTNPGTASPPNQVTVSNRQLFNLLACTEYFVERFQNSSATITEPLRFDICPGSWAYFEQDGETYYGLVMSVAYGINSDNNSAGTAIKLGFVQTASERASLTNPNMHPFFANLFSYASVSDAV